jgi:hypothetical protein
MVQFSLYRALSVAVMALLATGAGYLGYRVVRSEVEAGVYRDRLASLARDYETIRSRYNEAVRRTAVTELVVQNGALSVEVRDRAGERISIETPFNPAREVFVDYALVDGRLLIRRVFDSRTPPEQALLIDPALARVDWDAPDAAHGQAVYRTLSEGRWVISVTGNGALGLVRSTHDGPAPLAAAPPVRSYEEEMQEVNARLGAIGLSDLLRRLVSR